MQEGPTHPAGLSLSSGSHLANNSIAVPPYITTTSRTVTVLPPASVNEAVHDFAALLPKFLLEPEQIPTAMHKTWQTFGPSLLPQPTLDLVCKPAPFPLDTNFFKSNSKWDHDTATPAPSLISWLLAKSAAEHAHASVLSSSAVHAPTSINQASSLDKELTPGTALFECVKNAAHGLALALAQLRSANGKSVLAKASTLKGKGKAPVKQPHSAVNNSDKSVELVPSNAVKTLAPPAKRACSSKAQIADSITSLTRHIILEDAKYNKHAEATFAHHWELMQEMVSPLAAVDSGMLKVMKDLAKK
jgi:hypothetical protein